MKFGVMLAPYSVSFQRILDATARAEALGFDSVWVSDHLQRKTTPILECWTTIAALAAATKKVKLGSMATCNSFRNPALLAKMVATVSQISGGRVDLGIGVGYDETEHEAYGYAFPDMEKRVRNLSESLKVIMALWSGSKIDFDGSRIHLRGAICLPSPKARPRVWVAGRSDLVLHAAAQDGAYGVNILPYFGTGEKRRLCTQNEIEETVSKIDSYKVLKKSMYCGDGGVMIAETREEVSQSNEKTARLLGISTREMETRLRNLSVFYGTISECREKLQVFRSDGFEELMLYFPGWQKGDFAGMKTFAENFIRVVS
jgi:hypothetical protein